MALAPEVKVVIVNGYNLGSSDWFDVVIGKPGRLGRVPMALYTAIREDADYMLWNTGASKQMFYGNGSREVPDNVMLSEAEWTYWWMRINTHRLDSYFPDYFDPTTHGPVERLLRDKQRHLFETESINTMTSATAASGILDDLIGESPAHIISVSSRNHTRAGHHFQMVLQEGFNGRPKLRSKQLRVSHICSHTGYKEDGSFEHVQINECSGEKRYG